MMQGNPLSTASAGRRLRALAGVLLVLPVLMGTPSMAAVPQGTWRFKPPRAVVQNPTGYPGDHLITLWALTGSGLSEKIWIENDFGGTWSPWQHHGNPTSRPVDDWSDTLPILGWYDSVGRRRVNGLVSIAGGAVGFGEPWRMGPGMNWASGPPITPISGPTRGFFEPVTAFSWKQGHTTLLDFVGVHHRFSAQGSFLDSELWFRFWDGSRWSWDNHGLPKFQGEEDVNGNKPGGNPVAAEHLKLGPQSAVGHQIGNGVFRASVFTNVRIDSAEMARRDPPYQKVFQRYWNGGNWSWIDWGAPPVADWFEGGPLGIAYTDPRTGEVRWDVFVVAFNVETQSYTVWRRSDSRSTQATSWQLVTPNTVRGDNGRPIPLGKARLQMTSGVVWYDRHTLKIDLFGHTERSRIQGRCPHENETLVSGIVHLQFDGQSWRWADFIPSPDGTDIRTESSVVIDGPVDRITGNTEDHLRVFARTTPRGDIWELFRNVQNGAPGRWHWRRVADPPSGPLPAETRPSVGLRRGSISGGTPGEVVDILKIIFLIPQTFEPPPARGCPHVLP